MSKRILVVEDEREIARLVEIHLQDQGWEVTVHHDGAGGLAAATSGQFDLVILDLMLPGVDGLEICRRIRAASDYLPILMLTLVLGTPALSLFGAVGAALTVGLRRGGVLLALLILPLYVPVLIFGAGAVTEHMAGVATDAQIYWLAAITMLALTVAPFAVHAALRVSVEQ